MCRTYIQKSVMERLDQSVRDSSNTWPWPPWLASGEQCLCRPQMSLSQICSTYLTCHALPWLAVPPPCPKEQKTIDSYEFWAQRHHLLLRRRGHATPTKSEEHDHMCSESFLRQVWSWPSFFFSGQSEEHNPICSKSFGRGSWSWSSSSSFQSRSTTPVCCSFRDCSEVQLRPAIRKQGRSPLPRGYVLKLVAWSRPGSWSICSGDA